ncbi:hypothetical protein QKW60_05455 [Defluviimonas aestuarii]|uniref:hypothetical protein n=1 Tax=Albidovulum aestuarii TaxID=1130726 RepID=UPI00249AF8CD|nr:hypothetical protein [Defluviimonas aestuarii]MDI3335842.1 hypothetical protein [Defluviimonas aestuarii]
MTTKHSPLRVLKAQADEIAATICAAERGEAIDVQFAAKLEEARGKESVSVGIVMDDKIVRLDLPWSVIRSSGRVGLAEYILGQMRETRRAVH